MFAVGGEVGADGYESDVGGVEPEGKHGFGSFVHGECLFFEEGVYV